MSLALPSHADYSVKVNPHDQRGEWEGWGCSLAWWAHAVGGGNYESTYADLFFTEKTTTYLGEKLPGLNFNIIRYNIGGGGRGEKNGDIAEKTSDIIPWHRDIDGYWKNSGDSKTTSVAWDWSRDERQRSMMKAALRRNANYVEFFSNAPMWWMMDSNSSAGGHIQRSHHRNFAFYLSSVVAQAQKKWGVKVDNIEPFNEPSAGWWNYPKNQEGANISREDQAQILGLLREELDKQRLQKVSVAASDENTMWAARDTNEFFKEKAVTVNGESRKVADLIERVNVHSYQGLSPMRDTPARQRLKESVGAKKLWASEYGDNEGSGMTLAQTIMEDINNLRPTAWVYWQPLEAASAWGLVNADFGVAPTPDSGKPTWVYTKFYVLAQFSRTLRQGATIIGSNDANTVAAYNPKKRELAFVTVNYGSAQNIEYDLSNLKQSGKVASLTVTNTDRTKLFETSQVKLDGKKLKLNATSNTIYSLVVKGVTL